MTGPGLHDHRDIQEALGAYALDAVEPDEAELIDRHLQTCPRCRAEVQQHREVAGLLGYAGQDAPAGLWDRITATMQEAPPALRLERRDDPRPGLRVVGGGGAASAVAVPGHRPAGRRRTLRVRTAALLGAAAAAAIAVLGVQVSRLDHRTSTISSDLALGQPSMATVARALGVPGARHVVLTSDAGGEGLDAVILPGGQGYIYDTRLAALPDGQTYQLWGVTDGGSVSYGLLGSAPPQVVAFRAGDGVRALAVTAEVAGGVERSTHAPVAAGAVAA